ncbi:type I DNA topoisomerase [Anaerococcus hydrogenalis]|uniref:DNA topoisomerase 1 n=1 Tax=Anaerococcus hydrogenalis TaxID=33029 RepID=A0A2N6UJT3_9FIRM|nr:type I DNA topoisomerase [Anaerococcus hydrogenalis]MDK7695009.1 type I DNA topoisomerase [Anaerococcus hydrogenalis]MDK7697635.1 type I DNA topoisomerase [Anaerococcus hydrogenalis]MDK7708036.1 type I DNA topoisomerase [Anaerococcus hydrogenalis]PMC82005.1 type I DNA topoisomerase [Anaerococcus hydrogenalis]
MAKNLVIVESPTKAKSITKMLGSNYKVRATYGHLRDLPKSKLGVDIEDNFEPKYIKVRGKAKTINALKKEAQSVDKVYLATDPDREGEAISWHLQYLLGLDENELNRVEFHEITKNNVKNAIKNPRKIDQNLVDSQQARRIMDRIVGYEISPILWKRVKSGLSAGRVQSVALKLIVDKQKEIDAFVPEEYWTITAKHKESKIEFESEFYGSKSKKMKISNEDGAEKILNRIDKDKFEVVDIQKTKKKRKPQKPYTTSTLQQDASNKLGFSTKYTMSLAQQLFEGIDLGQKGRVGLITYMRTDATRLSNEIIGESLSYIKEKFGQKYASKGNSYSKKAKTSQDAHEAIRPTSIYNDPISVKEYLTDQQYKLYKLIWTRVVASQMADYEYLSTSISFDTNGVIFKTNGKITLFDGFMKVSNAKENENILPDLKKGDIIKAIDIKKDQHFTKPPANYTEASLVKTLEEYGIGRPSTYSSTIASIISRNYVEFEQRKILPTKLGMRVNDFLQESFDDIINVKFTAKMEDELDKIAQDEVYWKDVLKSFYEGFEKDIKKVSKDTTDYKVKDKILDEKCPKCGHPLAEKHGRNGKFIGCTNFPECDFTKSIIKTTGVKCPECNDGEIIEKVSKRGKRFYGCSNFPKCDYATWDPPTGEKCPECGDLLVHKKNRSTDEIKCNSCDYVKEKRR